VCTCALIPGADIVYRPSAAGLGTSWDKQTPAADRIKERRGSCIFFKCGKEITTFLAFVEDEVASDSRDAAHVLNTTAAKADYEYRGRYTSLGLRVHIGLYCVGGVMLSCQWPG